MLLSLLAALAVAVTPAPAVTATAGVPVSCMDDATWAGSLPASVGTALGVYDTRGRSIVLRSVICARLNLLAGGARSANVRYQYDFASSVFLLAHEIAHARGVDDEAAADCDAGRSFLRVSSSLGIGRAYGETLAGYLVNARIPRACYPR